MLNAFFCHGYIKNNRKQKSNSFETHLQSNNHFWSVSDITGQFSVWKRMFFFCCCCFRARVLITSMTRCWIKGFDWKSTQLIGCSQIPYYQTRSTFLRNKKKKDMIAKNLMGRGPFDISSDNKITETSSLVCSLNISVDVHNEMDGVSYKWGFRNIGKI